MNFDTVWSYCQQNKRLVPNPSKWNEVYGILKHKKQKSSGGWEPPLPLILVAWHHSMPIEKQLRFKEHIEWASKEGQLEEVYEFLIELKESDWIHFGEI